MRSPWPAKSFLPGFLVALTILGLAYADSSARGAVQAEGGKVLSEPQKEAIAAIRNESRKKALPLLGRLAKLAKEANENMLADRPDEERSRRLDQEIRRILSELLTSRLQAIHDSLRVLTPEQRRLLKTKLAQPDAPADLMDLLVRTFQLPKD